MLNATAEPCRQPQRPERAQHLQRRVIADEAEDHEQRQHHHRKRNHHRRKHQHEQKSAAPESDLGKSVRRYALDSVVPSTDRAAIISVLRV